MNPVPFSAASPPPLPPPWFPALPPNAPPSSAFWQTKKNVHDQLSELRDTLNLATAIQKELEALMTLKNSQGSTESGLSEHLKDRKIELETQEPLSVEAANALVFKLRALIEPFRVLADENVPWEEKSAAVRLNDKVRKSMRNKVWRKRKRKRAAEMRSMEREQFEKADQEADEWRARETAKEIAQLKVDKMKEIAKLKAKEERKRLESELELVLIVEKLQQLRSMRIQKLKKQGHFLPEEDDKFLEKVRTAVEEEERQAIAAADTDKAKDAIAVAEGSRKTIQNLEPISSESGADNDATKGSNDKMMESRDTKFSGAATGLSEEKGSERQGYGGVYDSVASLPIEFYHYYHGSNNDMGTLIEVRRTWDAYMRPGGSRIPGHWVQPPPPADDIWASYLVKR